MSPEVIATLAGVVVAAFIGAIGGAWALARRHEKTELVQLKTQHTAEVAELKQGIAETRLEHAASLARLEQELTSARAHIQNLTTELEQITQQHKNLLSGRTGVVLKTEIDHELLQKMRVLGVTAASVLIQAPPPNDRTSLVFLSAFGPVANRIRTDLVDMKNSKAGKVFETGILDNSQDPRRDPDWDSSVDAKAEFETLTLLTVPVKLRDDPARAWPYASS
jgi:hypothetical protein